MNLGALGLLGATLGFQKVRGCIPSLHFCGFCLQMGPHSGPKNQSGGRQVGIWASNDVFWKGLFQDLHFTPNQIPQFYRKRHFFAGIWQWDLEVFPNLKFPWPTPHAADPSLCSMSFLGTSWHDLICIGSLVLSYWRNVIEHCIIHRKAIPEALILGHILSEFGSHFEWVWEPGAILGPPWDLKG